MIPKIGWHTENQLPGTEESKVEEKMGDNNDDNPKNLQWGNKRSYSSRTDSEFSQKKL